MSKQSDAEDFLRTYLADGPQLDEDVWATATERDISAWALKQAKVKLDVVKTSSGRDTIWRMRNESDPPGRGQTCMTVHANLGGGISLALKPQSERSSSEPVYIGLTTAEAQHLARELVAALARLDDVSQAIDRL